MGLGGGLGATLDLYPGRACCGGDAPQVQGSHRDGGFLLVSSFGGCNDLFVTGSFLADIAFTTNSRAVQFVANRLANQIVVPINGANHSITACDIRPQILPVQTGLTDTVIGPKCPSTMD